MDTENISNINEIKEKKEYNYQMSVLKAIAICMVVFGHIRADRLTIGTFYGWFPYYSVHLALFMFAAGYFFPQMAEKKPLSFILKRALRYLVPYCFFHLLFYAFQRSLDPLGYSYGKKYMILSFIIESFTTDGIQTFAAPSWFVISLLISELYLLCIRLICSVIGNDKVKEITVSLVCICCSFLFLNLSNDRTVTATYLVLIRAGLLLPFMETGFLYRKYFEKFDTLSSGWYFALVFTIQMIIIIITKNNDLHFKVYALLDFENTGYEFYAAGLNGIALWLRVSRIIAQMKRSKLISFIGDNTSCIMYTHLFGFFLFNLIICCFKNAGIFADFLSRFNIDRFKSEIYFTFKAEPRMIMMYFFFGIIFSFPFILLKNGIESMLKRKKV